MREWLTSCCNEFWYATAVIMFALILLALIAPTLAQPVIGQSENRADKIQLFGTQRPLSSRDHLHVRFSNIGINPSSGSGHIIYTSILSNEECLLKRFSEYEEVCETFQRNKCKPGTN